MSDLGFVHKYVPAEREGFPTILVLHGTGGNELDLIPLVQQVAQGAGILSVRGKVLENGMPRFFRRFAEGVFDLEDLAFRTAELSQFVAAARVEYDIVEPPVAFGYSNGANIAASIMLTHPGVLAGGILLRAMPTLTVDTPPDLHGLRILLAAGRRDPIVRVEQSVQLHDTFEACGAEVEMHWHEGGHELGHDDLNAAQRWLNAPGAHAE